MDTQVLYLSVLFIVKQIKFISFDILNTIALYFREGYNMTK